MNAVIAAMLVSALVTPAFATDVEVHVLNVNAPTGSVRVQLCQRAQWMNDCTLSARVSAARGVVSVTVPDVPPGVYGVIAFHDANDNGDVDQNFIGLPTEGVGFSRDATIRLGAPRFDDAALRIEGPRVVVGITLHFEP